MKAAACYRAWLVLLVLGAGMNGGVEAQTLLHIAEVRNLPSRVAAQGLPVHVHGVATLPFWGNDVVWFVVQDDSAGICVNLSEARRLHVWHGDDSALAQVRRGTEVEIEGVSHGGGFAPVILPQTLRIMGEKPLPAAHPLLPEEFFEGCDDCQLISDVRGVVQEVKRLGWGWALRIDTSSHHSFTAELSPNVVPDPYQLVDADICLRGVTDSVFNSRGEFVGPRLLISEPGDLVVETPPPRSPFDAPKAELNQMFSFSPKPLAPHRVATEGVVTYAQPNGVFYLQHGNSAVQVEPLSRGTIQLGDKVQVAGFVNMERSVAGLIGAEVRKVGTASLPKAVIMEPSEILDLVKKAEVNGQSAEPSDFDGHLITFQGRLLDIRPSPGSKPTGCQLTVRDISGMLTEVLLQQGNPSAFDSLRIGSELQLTGIAQLIYSEYRGELIYSPLLPSGLQILLRDPNDVAVLHAAPWWTTRRLVGLIVFGVLVLFCVLLWLWQLGSQLARRSKQLAVEMRARRDVVLEFQATFRERNRLAANLHDTLLQTMSGLSYQLMACETESLPSADRKVNHLATARRMTQRAQEDLRGTVWALRVLPLHGRSFAEAIRMMADRLAEGRSVTVAVTVDNELPSLPEFIAGNLLLLAQEAMLNAIKHAQPSRIETQVFLQPDRQHITLLVRDDGIGFTPQTQPVPDGRHFGLAGMRERAERLGGELMIETKPGLGTTVRAEVPLKHFDEDVEESDHENTHPSAPD